jgi:hypothetical protein
MSSELNDEPSWNFTFLRSLKVKVRPSGETVQLSARSPVTSGYFAPSNLSSVE